MARKDPTPTGVPLDRESTLADLDAKLDALDKQVHEIHVVKQLIAWSIPLIVTGALSFAVTAAVAFYRLDDMATEFQLHTSAPATVAHPGTADALWEVKQTVTELRGALQLMQREAGLRDTEGRERLARIEAQLDRLVDSSASSRRAQTSGSP